MFTIFITATNTGVGKTFAAISLLKALASVYPSLRIGVCKPIETGVKSTPLDALALLKTCKAYNHNFFSLIPQDLTAYTFKLPAAPFVAAKSENQKISLERVFLKIESFKKRCDILVVEGAGGLMVPITKEYFMIDLLKEIANKTLLITPSKLGCINETLLSIEALEKREINFEWCINLYEEKSQFQTVSEPFYKSYFQDYWFLENGILEFAKRLSLLD